MYLVIVSYKSCAKITSERCVYSSKGQKAHDVALLSEKVESLTGIVKSSKRHPKDNRMERQLLQSLKKISFY